MRIRKSQLAGCIKVPPSKSHSHRALLFAALCSGTSCIKNLLNSPDIDQMKRALQLLGAKIEGGQVTGFGNRPGAAKGVIDAGNSGIIYRFIAGVAALSPYPTTITGDASIRYRRPIQPLLSGINQLGGEAFSVRGDGSAPITVRGPIKTGHAKILGHDSQPVSALLITAALGEGPFTIEVEEAAEKEWIDLTLSWLTRMEIQYEREGYMHFHLPGNSTIAPFEMTIPGDFSSAAFPLAAALVTGSEIELEGLDFDDTQGDKKVFDLLESLGARVQKNQESISVNGEISGGEIDLAPFVDALPILATLACFAKKPTRLYGGEICRKKECDRITSIAKELTKMGAKIEELSDGLIVYPSTLRGAHLQSHNDHRIAMALAVAAMGATGESQIDGFSAAEKTYPNFRKDFLNLGAQIV